MVKLSEIFPILGIENQYINSIYADVTFGYEVSWPEIFCYEKSEYNILHDSIVRLIKRLPHGTVFHKLDYYYVSPHQADFDEADTQAQRWDNENTHRRPILNTHSQVYITVSNHVRKFARPSLKKNSLVKRYQEKYRQITKSKLAELGDKAEELVGLVTSELNSIEGVEAKRMDNEQLRKGIYEYVSLSYSSEIETNDYTLPTYLSKPYTKVGKDFLSVVTLIEEGKGLWIYEPSQSDSDNFGNGLAAQHNKMESPLPYAYPLGNGLPFDHIVSTSIEVGNNENTITGLKADQLANVNPYRFIGNEKAAHKVEETEAYINSLFSVGYTPTITSLNVLLQDFDRQKLSTKVNAVLSAMSKMNSAKGIAEVESNLATFFSLIPGAVKSNHTGFINVVEQAVTYLNLLDNYKSDSDGVQFQDRFGKPIKIDLWDSPIIVNRNKLIIAPSGEGKSMFINWLIDDSYSKGHHVILLDVGASYRKNCLINNGVYFDSSNKEELGFNIFEIEKTDEQYNPTQEHLIFLTSVLLLIWKRNNKYPITGETEAILMNLVIAFYKFANTHYQVKPNFEKLNSQHFWDFIDYYEENILEERQMDYFDFVSFKLLLQPFMIGEYRFVFEGENSLSTLLHKRLVIFDLEGIKSDKTLLPVVFMIVIEMTLKKVKALKGVKKSFIIDEGWDFLSESPFLVNFIKSMYRQIRKKEGEVYLATQNVQDVGMNEEIRAAITINTSTKILFSHKTARESYPALQSILGITNRELSLMEDLQKDNGESGYREFLLKMGEKAKIFRYNVSPKLLSLYDSREVENKKIYCHYQKHGNMKLAIEEYLQEK